MHFLDGVTAGIRTYFHGLKNEIYEFFTQNNANLIKIEGLSRKILSVQREFHRGAVDPAMDNLRYLLIDNARFQICSSIRSAEARAEYQKFSDQLERVQRIYANRPKVQKWVDTSSLPDKA